MNINFLNRMIMKNIIFLKTLQKMNYLKLQIIQKF
jgi:hypothetical protein